jgi:bifunctional non-homologous end joining protein LigD
LGRVKNVEPARLVLRRQPFSHPDWLFELKYDGFRSLAYINKNVKLVSRNGNVYKRFSALCAVLATLRLKDVVLDGEIICLDAQGRTRFYDLMFRRGEPRFAALDILWKDGRDLRSLPLTIRITRQHLFHNLTMRDRAARAPMVTPAIIAIFAPIERAGPRNLATSP